MTRTSIRRLGIMVLETIFLWAIANPAFSEEILKINSMHSDPAPRKALAALVKQFEKENPGVKVKVNTIDHESFKIQIRTWLPNNPPDVVSWFAGNRAKYFVDMGLVEPLPDIWKDLNSTFSKSSREAVSFNGVPYLLPTTYYQWGIFYRKDLFKKAGITAEPKTWEELLTTVEKLKKSGVTPFAIGTKNAWPAAAWFDFINMRLHGYKAHMKLLNGESSYVTPEVKESFAAWRQLIDRKAFPETAPAMTWQEAASLMWLGKAGMYLMGNFISAEMPDNVRGKMGFFQFPEMKKGIARAEVAPTDVYLIPKKAKNKKMAKKFLRFLARAETQEKMNETAKQLSPNTKAKIDPNDEFLIEGHKVLSTASAVSQFYDRDADPRVAKVGMDGFVEFMAYPDRVDRILKKIDKTRKRVNRSH